MSGIIDESGTLNYGEVFIQHTVLNQSESETDLGDGHRQYHLYCNKLQLIIDLYAYRTEAELITGCQPLLSDEKRSSDAADVAEQDFKRLCRDTQHQFLNEFVRTNEKQERRRDRNLTVLSTDPNVARRQLQKALIMLPIPKRTTTMSTPCNQNSLPG